MAFYSVQWKASAAKEIKKLPKKDLQRVITKINALKQNPFPNGSLKLTGSECTYRFRVGDYRVIYNLLESILTIEIVRVRHRKDVYDNL
jgi:mRNA interferase RelE/StbE